MPIKPTKFSFSLPFGIGQIELETDTTQKRAAWSLYVELITRIAIQPLEPTHGLLSEALNSLYSLFAATREILRDAGPQVAAKGEKSFGSVAIRVLNEGVRPFTAKWHPVLLAYEKTRTAEISEYEYEQQWERAEEMRGELANLQKDLEVYAEILANIAGIKHTKIY